jgi:predicted RNase H-like nuclease (RuvC/YqgF family)
MSVTDYGRGLHKQLCEQTEKAEGLERENRQLRQENRQLRKKVESLEERLDRMNAEMDAKINAAISKAVAPLRKEIAIKDTQIQKAHDEIDRLKASRDKDSGNSSKPPSTS